MTHKQNEIAAHLLRIGAVKINAKNPFTWSSGLKSPIYCDNRLLLSYPEVREQVCEAFVEVANNWLGHDVIGGVATAGIPHGALVADRLKKPFIYVRSAAKKHGRQNQIEGKLDSEQSVLLIEDLISTGGSSLKAAEAVNATGARVVGILAIFSYGFDIAKKASLEADIPFRTIITLDDLLNSASESGEINVEERKMIAEWRNQPQTWSERITSLH